MNPEQIIRWRKDILARLDVLKSKVRQTQQYLEAKNLHKLKDKDKDKDKEDIEEAWFRVQERFPADLKPPRVSDLNRHLHFAMQQDFSDIENLDIPAIEGAIKHYGRHGNEFIEHELAAHDVEFEAWELLHPQVRDACMTQFDNGMYRDAARTAVELLMDEIRRITGRQDDGDVLIRGAVGVNQQIAFSAHEDNNQKSITEGLKLVLQGFYKGIRNPASHGYNGFARLDTFQIMIMCSFLLSRLQLNIGSTSSM